MTFCFVIEEFVMSILMFIHVLFGTSAVVCGCVALCCKKGACIHRLTGQVYVVAMVIMALAGGVLATILAQPINILACGLTCYLVVTAWHAAHYKKITSTLFCYLTGVFILLVAIVGYYLGWQAMRAVDGYLGGYHYFAYFFIASIALIGATLDGYLLNKGSLNASQRLVRHIWRMTFSYFIAAGSLFTGPGKKAFPEFIQQSGILEVPEPLILIVLFYWVITTKWKGRKLNRL